MASIRFIDCVHKIYITFFVVLFIIKLGNYKNVQCKTFKIISHTMKEASYPNAVCTCVCIYIPGSVLTNKVSEQEVVFMLFCFSILANFSMVIFTFV